MRSGGTRNAPYKIFSKIVLNGIRYIVETKKDLLHNIFQDCPYPFFLDIFPSPERDFRDQNHPYCGIFGKNWTPH